MKGSRLTADELRLIFQGLLANELLDYDYILTGRRSLSWRHAHPSESLFTLGYMGSGELLHVVAEHIRLIKAKCPHVKYSTYEGECTTWQTTLLSSSASLRSSDWRRQQTCECLARARSCLIAFFSTSIDRVSTCTERRSYHSRTSSRRTTSKSSTDPRAMLAGAGYDAFV